MKAATAHTRTKFQNVLFTTDFSAAAAHAVPYVEEIAKQYHSNVVVLHVRPAVVSPITPPGTWGADVEAAKAIDEEHRQEILRAFGEVPTRVVIKEGDIRPWIEDSIEKYNIDLVVLGTRGRTGLGKLLLGSVAEEIFRTVTCPVLTVGPHAGASTGAKGEFREILYATDFSAEAHPAAGYALSLAQEFEANLILLHVVPEPKSLAISFRGSTLTRRAKSFSGKSSPQKQKLGANPNTLLNVVTQRSGFLTSPN